MSRRTCLNFSCWKDVTVSDEGFRSADVSGASGHGAEINVAKAVTQSNLQPPPLVADDLQREQIQLAAGNDNLNMRAPILLNDNEEEHVPGVAVEVLRIDAEVDQKVIAAATPTFPLAFSTPPPFNADDDDDNPQMSAPSAPPGPSPVEQHATHKLVAEIELNPLLNARAAESESPIGVYAEVALSCPQDITVTCRSSRHQIDSVPAAHIPKC